MDPIGFMAQPYKTIITSPTVTDKTIKDAYTKFEARIPRYNLLHDYYIGKHRFPADANATVVSNLCGYIVRSLKGYMLGNRPIYELAEDDGYGQQIVDLFNRQNKWLVDAELEQSCSIYGRANELCFRDSRDPRIPKSADVDVRDSFVAYAGDMEQDSVFGCVRYVERDEQDKVHYTLYVYTAEDVQIWISDSPSDGWTMKEEPTPHGFGRVPLIEYKNNSECLGDFEQIIGLQDAYNELLSDRLDDKTAFAQAMLAIKGQVIGYTPDEIEESLGKARKHKVIHLDDGADAQYLIKTMDESGVQIYQDQLRADIHKIAMVPDLSDEQFAGNASGVAMAYKMFGTDQMVADKIANFEKGYKRRCKLYDAVMFNGTASPDYEPRSDIGAMNIRFRFNVPQDLSYMAQALTTAIGGGFLSTRTAMEQLSIVNDISEEERRIAEDNASSDARQKAMFEDDYARDFDATYPEEEEDAEE